jgi:hypothetical protein
VTVALTRNVARERKRVMLISARFIWRERALLVLQVEVDILTPEDYESLLTDGALLRK